MQCLPLNNAAKDTSHTLLVFVAIARKMDGLDGRLAVTADTAVSDQSQLGMLQSTVAMAVPAADLSMTMAIGG